MENEREEINIWIGKRMKEIREEQKISLNRMAALTGRSVQNLSNIEAGRNKMFAFDLAMMYSRILNISLSQLLGEDFSTASSKLMMTARTLPKEKGDALADAARILFPEYFRNEPEEDADKDPRIRQEGE